MEDVVLKKIDEWEFRENIEESLREDNISESCYTNFKDALAETIYQMIHEKFGKKEWDLNYLEYNKEEKVFNAFMKNSEFEIVLKKKDDDTDNMSKKVIVKLDFPEDEKKRIAEIYIDTILEGYYYLDLCLFVDDEEDIESEDYIESEKEINVDTVSNDLSKEVYGLLSPEEIKAEFKDKIEEAINIVFGEEEE